MGALQSSPQGDLAMTRLNLDQGDFGRFRAAWVEGGQLLVRARIGGGNRPEYKDDIMNLRQHPNYIDDEDVDSDCTYAIFTFSLSADDMTDINTQLTEMNTPKTTHTEHSSWSQQQAQLDAANTNGKS